ncbi:TPA: metallophosphoesterase [Thermoplasmata archaeon]|nr:metallophosphoesterase [Thermoplasmata archaeon]
MRGYRLDDETELLPGGALLLRKPRTVVVADLHLGCEAALEYQGLSLPRVQTARIGEYLKEVVDAVGPDQLVIAGDLKHNFSRNLLQEWEDVSSFVHMVADLVDLVVVRGNHDNYLSMILNDLGIPLRREHRVGGTTVLHGHAASEVGGRLVFGHLHPSVTLRDDAGAGLKAPCFLVDRAAGMLILPPLSIVSPGVDVILNISADRMSPLLPPSGLRSFSPVVFSGSRPLAFPAVGPLRDGGERAIPEPRG